ncbi:MAG: hypothetical protein IKV43_05485 [Clostridia bacterium]|nr:hypothetical protein [Clostridia bacterium]
MSRITPHGPLQIVHDFKFVALNVKDDYSVLDGLDRDGKVAYIKGRLDRLRALGYGGVVMNIDYTDYMRVPEAFDIFFDAAAYAKEIGLAVWIYDEQYYPSGAAGGLTLMGHPELEAVCLACVSRDVTVEDELAAIRIPSPCGYSELKYAVIAPIVDGEVQHDKRRDISDSRDLGGGLCHHTEVGRWRVWCFFLRPLFEHTKFCQSTRATRRYISVFNKEAVERFYDVTFRDGYMAHATGPLSDIVDAVFTDEPYSPFYTPTVVPECRTYFPSVSIFEKANSEVPIYPYVAWGVTLAEKYEEKYGRSIALSLPDLFEETPSTRAARVEFYSLLSDMSLEAFAMQMSERLGKEGIHLSGHYYGEEGFDNQPIFYGNILDHLSLMGIPGCDALWSDMDRLRYSTSCKLASSAAHLSGRPEVMIEASNMVDADQNISLARLKAAMSAIFVHGVNVITSYYGEHLLPDGDMQAFTTHIRNLSRLFRGGKYRINTLLYYPFENLCARREPLGLVEGCDVGADSIGIGKTAAQLMMRQVGFDFIGKRQLLGLKRGDGCLIAPNGDRVEFVVLPALLWLDGEVSEFLAAAVESGVRVIFDGEVRDIDGVNFAHGFMCEGDYPTAMLTLKKENQYVITMQKTEGMCDRFLILNTDTEGYPITASLPISGGRLTITDLTTLTESEMDYTVCDGVATVKLELQPLEATVITRYNDGTAG